MLYRIILSLFALMILAAPPAMAERAYKGGMSYVVVNDDKPAEAAAAQPAMKSKRIHNSLKQGTEEKTTPEGIAKDIWEKYKELAAGTDSDTIPEKQGEHKGNSPVKPDKPDSVDVSAGTAQTETPMAGLAGIIARYHEKKEARSQMRRLQVNRPEKPQIAKPEKPATEAE